MTRKGPGERRRASRTSRRSGAGSGSAWSAAPRPWSARPGYRACSRRASWSRPGAPRPSPSARRPWRRPTSAAGARACCRPARRDPSPPVTARARMSEVVPIGQHSGLTVFGAMSGRSGGRRASAPATTAVGRVGEAHAGAVGEGEPAGEVERGPVGAEARDIVRRPVDPHGEIAEGQLVAARPSAPRRSTERVGRSARPGGRWSNTSACGPAPQPSASTPASVCDHHAIGARAQRSRLLGDLAGLRVDAAQGDALADRLLDQRAGVQQVVVEVALDQPPRQAGHRGAGRDDAVGDALGTRSACARPAGRRVRVSAIMARPAVFPPRCAAMRRWPRGRGRW